jgi:rRNA maturation protein Nop10
MIYYRMEGGERRYTLDPKDGELAQPAKYSVGDQFSRQRIEMKRRYKIFPFDRDNKTPCSL